MKKLYRMYVAKHNRCTKGLHFRLVALANPNFKTGFIEGEFAQERYPKVYPYAGKRHRI